MHKGDREKMQSTIREPIALLRGVFLALFITMAVLAVFSFLVSIGMLRELLVEQITALSCTAGAFGGGLLGAKNGKRRVLSGLLVGTLLFIVLFIIGVLVYDTATVGKEDVMLGLSCLCGGMLAGLFLPKSASKRKKGEGRGRRKKR